MQRVLRMSLVDLSSGINPYREFLPSSQIQILISCHKFKQDVAVQALAPLLIISNETCVHRWPLSRPFGFNVLIVGAFSPSLSVNKYKF